MANEIVKFLYGKSSNLPSTLNAGTFYVTSDDEAMYLEVGGSRIRVGGVKRVANITALKATADHNTNHIYYVVDLNALCVWSDKESDYVQINPDTGVTSVEVVGNGNAVTDASYDEKTRKLTLTKGATYTTPSDVDSQISNNVGDLKIGEESFETVKAYVDKKTDGIATDVAIEALTGRVTAAENDIDALQDDSHTHENKAELDKIASGDKAKWDAEIGSAAAIALIKDGVSIDSFKDVENALAGKQPTGDYATKAEAQGYADAKDTAIAAAKKAGDDAQADVDALETKIGTVPADKTVVEMISDAQTAATYDDTQVKADIKANADAIGVLNGSGEGSVNKKITDAFNDFSTKVTDDAVVNSYKELIDWAATHGAEAAEMASAITALQNILDGIGGEGESNTVVAYVQAAIDALKIGDYAKAADLTALATRVATLEGKVVDWDDAVAKEHEHANKALLDTYTQTEANLADAVAKKHEHANKSELDKFETGDKSKLDTAASDVSTIKGDYLKDADKTELKGDIASAQTAAEKKATDLNAAMNTRVTALEEIDHNAYVAADTQVLADAKAYANGLLTWGTF